MTIAHGIDLVDFKRIKEMTNRHGDRFLERIFTAKEQKYAKDHKKNEIEKLAGRFAAKEAVLKLIGTGWRGKIAWTDIEIVNDSLGKPIVNVTGEVKKIVESLQIKEIAISITHTADFAMASAIAVTDVR